ncbi:MAG TPA: hypothetical protein VH206_06600 [Xanthobacteraceae bacterium]|jgi:hypothetical protein|nr:hypothetical protein [Xanthobacteraceae bacterium]
MDDTLVKTLLAIAGAVIGAIIAGVTNAYAAKQKIREVEISLAYKLRDGYLENARKMAEDVYIPINIAFTKLANAYDQFRRHVEFEKMEVPLGAKNAFLGACRTYLTELDELFARGADAYLTNELDSTIRRFNSFLHDSLSEASVTTKVVLEASISIPFVSAASGRFERSFRSTKAVAIPSMSVKIPGNFGISYGQEVLSAALPSREFEKRFKIDFAEIKALIKEVILGSHSGT